MTSEEAKKEVTVIVRLESLPEETAELRRQIIAVLRKARREPGYLACELLIDLDNPLHFVLYERWRSVEELFAYNNQPYHKEFEKSAQELCGEPGGMPVYVGKIQAARFQTIEF
jgi:quinol monooxygenase YgiN